MATKFFKRHFKDPSHRSRSFRRWELLRKRLWKHRRSQAAEFTPPTTSEAELTRVVTCKGFLSSRRAERLRYELARLPLQPYTSEPDDWDGDRAVHCTKYVNTHGLFKARFAWLRSRILALALAVDAREDWNVLLPNACAGKLSNEGRGRRELPWPQSVAIRCAEFHEMLPGGGLRDLNHFDVGSLITIDVMLSEPKSGGHFQTVERHGRIRRHRFNQGDALVFLGHKRHHVTPVISGHRKVFVVELWKGAERECGHRCDMHEGACTFQGG